jgi:hypothetical protein
MGVLSYCGIGDLKKRSHRSKFRIALRATRFNLVVWEFVSANALPQIVASIDISLAASIR